MHSIHLIRFIVPSMLALTMNAEAAPVQLASDFASDPASRWWLEARRQAAGFVVLTVANMPVPGFCRLAASAMIHDVPLTVLYWNQSLPQSISMRHGRRQGWQLLKYRSISSALNPTSGLLASGVEHERTDERDIVAFVDGFDTFFVNSAAKLVDTFRKSTASASNKHKIVMSAECNKSPTSIDYGPKNVGAELPYVNSGVLMGDVGKVRELSTFIDGALEHLSQVLCADEISQRTFNSKVKVSPPPEMRVDYLRGLENGTDPVKLAKTMGVRAVEHIVSKLKCTGLPGVSDQLFAHYAYLLGVANLGLDMRASLCLSMFSCHRRGRAGFSPEDAVNSSLFSRTGQISVRPIKIRENDIIFNNMKREGFQSSPSIVHANGNRKFRNWEYGLAQALRSPALNVGCVRTIGPGGDDRCRSYVQLGCKASMLSICDPASIGCKLS